jgi:hypothetical protein
MKAALNVKIIHIKGKEGYDEYLHECLAPMFFRKHKCGERYREKAVPKRLRRNYRLLMGQLSTRKSMDLPNHEAIP